jgi:hypothetical protein
MVNYALPYSGDILSYGQGPEFNFFGNPQQAPSSQQAAPVIVPSWAAIVGGGGQAAGSSGTEVGGDNGSGAGMLSTGANAGYTGGGFNITPADWGTIGGALGTGLSFAGLPGAGILGSAIGNGLAVGSLNQEMQGMGLNPTLGMRDALGSTFGSLGMGLAGSLFDIPSMGERFANAVDAQAQDEPIENFITGPSFTYGQSQGNIDFASDPMMQGLMNFNEELDVAPASPQLVAAVQNVLSQAGLTGGTPAPSGPAAGTNTFGGTIDPTAPGWSNSQAGQYSAGVLGDTYGTGVGGGNADPGGGAPADGSPGGYGEGGSNADPGGYGGDSSAYGGNWASGGAIPSAYNRPYNNQHRAMGGQINGPGDGLSDSVPAMIDGQEPASLSTDEHVIPADVVSMIGNGSSQAGHKKLQNMMAQVRQQKTGRKRQARPLKARTLGQLAA